MFDDHAQILEHIQNARATLDVVDTNWENLRLSRFIVSYEEGDTIITFVDVVIKVNNSNHLFAISVDPEGEYTVAHKELQYLSSP
ncbi:MAG: hypothetical protein AAF267_17645 [Deinococcota bacterium]